LKCPFCQFEESKVTDSRNAVETNAIRRRRECLGCQRRFTTFETVDLTVQVKKRDGTYEDFEQEKLVKGLDAACRHTRISHELVRKIAYDITKEIMEKQVKEISTKELGELVLDRLKTTDVIAYIRFACVYKRFKSIGQLTQAIQAILPKEEPTVEKPL
jgi:transcriptional repressor NrdR